MITITEQKEKITITGHANYAVRGSDIVCAGVSALAETLGRSLALLCDCPGWFVPVPGDTQIVNKALDERGRLLIDAFFIGIDGIAGAFPEYVMVTRLGWEI